MFQACISLCFRCLRRFCRKIYVSDLNIHSCCVKRTRDTQWKNCLSLKNFSAWVGFMEIYFTWQLLADVDSKIAASLLDKDTCRSHKVTPVPKPRKLNKKLKSCYASALENVSFQPLQQSFVRDSKYTSFGVFAKVFIDNNSVIAGLVGFSCCKPNSL